MAQNDRLKTLLEKQDAADRAYVAELARQATAESLARASRTRIQSEWWHLCRVLKQTMVTANDAMTGGRKLYSQPYNPHAERTIGDLIIMFENEYSEYVDRKCVVGVDPEGTVSISMNSMSQRKDYQLNIWSATIEQIEAIVYDFMELNISIDDLRDKANYPPR
jgi:hypothetical protein